MAKISKAKRFNNIDSMISDMKDQIGDFDSCDKVDVEVESADEIQDGDDVESEEAIFGDEKPSDDYILALEELLTKDLQPDTDSIVYNVTDNALIVIIAKNEEIQEFEVPFIDLTKDELKLDKDKDYIEDAINSWIEE